jgi:uncharacterized protein
VDFSWNAARRQTCADCLLSDFKALALNDLGFMYGSDRGVPKSSDAARAWYNKIADQGSATGQFNHGQIHQREYKDDAEAEKWYRKADKQEFEPAKMVLQRMGWN